MSQYLTIYKNDIDIVDFTRSSPVHIAFDMPYTEDKKELTANDIIRATNEVTEKIEEIKQGIERYEKIFNNCKSLEDMYEVRGIIDEYQSELEEWKWARLWVSVVDHLFNQCYDNSKLYYTEC